MKWVDYMDAALDRARYALEIGETPVGCVFVHGGQVIADGINDTNRSKSGIRHAEMVAIDKVLAQHNASVFKQTDLFVSVEPCIMCAAALDQLHVRAVYFGCGNDKFGGCGSIMSMHRNRSTGQLAFLTYPGIRRLSAIMLLRQFYMQQNPTAPSPQLKASRKLKKDFDDFNWSKYLTESELQTAIQNVYGIDPRSIDFRYS